MHIRSMPTAPPFAALVFAALTALACGSAPTVEVPATARPALSPASSVRAPAPVALLLISLDAVRWDYPERYGMPAFLQLAEDGVRVRELIPVFPSKTFPNHYSAVTGLYPEHHGVVGNNMFDPVQNAYFGARDKGAVAVGDWWQGEPIWVTAERQGQRAATYFWPGSEAVINGVRPTYYVKFDADVSAQDRIDKVLAWLELPAETRPSMVTLYFGDVDRVSHRYGPETAETRAVVQQVDGYLARLFAALRERELFDRMDIVIMSDHGMTTMDPGRIIILEDYIDLGDVEVVDMSCVAMLRPRADAEERVYRALLGAHPNLHVARKHEVPERLHYRAHRRITPIVSWTDPGWYVIPSRTFMKRFLGSFSHGMHGFDPEVKDMHGIFAARGPSFVRGLEVPALEMVHVYELMTRARGLRPAANDGDPGAVAPMFVGSAPPRAPAE